MTDKNILISISRLYSVIDVITTEDSKHRSDGAFIGIDDLVNIKSYIDGLVGVIKRMPSEEELEMRFPTHPVNDSFQPNMFYMGNAIAQGGARWMRDEIERRIENYCL